jgi:hypothetical protein
LFFQSYLLFKKKAPVFYTGAPVRERVTPLLHATQKTPGICPATTETIMTKSESRCKTGTSTHFIDLSLASKLYYDLQMTKISGFVKLEVNDRSMAPAMGARRIFYRK